MMTNNITRISVQRFVVAGDVMNAITAYDERDYRIGREQRIFQSKPLTDNEVRKSVNATGEIKIPIKRETLGPAIAGKW